MKLLSPAIKAASAFTLGGAAFALANLLLARYLSTEAYGEFSLVLAMAVLGISLGPLGLDAIVLRHRPGPRRILFISSLMTGLILAAVTVAAGHYLYGIEGGFLIALALAIASGSVARLAASVYQSEKRFKISLLLIQSQNITLIGAAIAAGIVAFISAQLVFSAYALHWTSAAIVGLLSLRLLSRIPENGAWSIPWREGMPLFGYLLTVQLAAQLDRLLIPKLLDLESLATFGVLSALVLAPFKMFQTGVGYTLVPGLRNADSKAARRKNLVHEAGVTALVIAGGAASGFLIAPWFAELFLKGKYVLGPALIGAAIFAGAMRVIVMFVSSIVTALGTQEHLAWLNRSSWLALAMSVVGAWLGARWGLAGLIFGFSLGSLLRALLAAFVAVRVWNQPVDPDPESVLPV
jgi:O-antigen/teichoic acid export membrane protein